MTKRALISVSNKTGVDGLAAELVQRGYQIVSSGGTRAFLRDAGIDAIAVSELTGFPEILDGRVKTLHPHVHAALLARYELDDHVRQLDELSISPIQLVVVNLYPFAATIARTDVGVADAIEQIDIGGPTMVRAAAKNFKHITVLTDPADYGRFLQSENDLAFRLEMARKAFAHTHDYDARVADYFDRVSVDDGELVAGDPATCPPTIRVTAERAQSLRYGENPHQSAALYLWGDDAPGFEQLQGKPLSYNNLVDMDSAWRCVREFEALTAVVVKHTNPCGVGTGATPAEAFQRARMVDPVSSFGGVIALNREVDLETARAINENFAELVIAPAFSDDARKAFKRKKRLRLLRIPDSGVRTPQLEIKRLDAGLLVQSLDDRRLPPVEWDLKSKRRPTDAELRALEMAWRIVAHVKSNAIVYADAQGAVGIGAGQMSRVDSARIAVWKAREAELSLAGVAMASDAFFPFRDSIDAAAEAGVRAVVEPGGSIRDDEVIEAADERDMVLFFTGTRHFKH